MDYAAFVDFVRDNKDLVVLALSLMTSVTGVGLWRTAYNSFRVSRWGVRKVVGAYVARCEAKEKRKTDALAVLIDAALHRQLDARTTPTPYITFSNGNKQEDALLADHTCRGT